METAEEGKDCFFSYHAKAELPHGLFMYVHVVVSYPTLVIILYNFSTAPVTSYLEQNMTVFVMYYLTEYYVASN